MSQAQITISVDSLLKLPAGASYHTRNGQARAEVSLRGDTIYVTGTCDSLTRQVEYYENLYHTTRDTLEGQIRELAKSDRRERQNPLWLLATTFMLGLLFGAITTIFIIIKTKQK